MVISVIIPLYNKGEKICKAIDSVLNQNYPNYEIIVVDDGSTDDSSEYVKKYSDKRIKYIYKDNGGVSKARNFGIIHATGEWLYFLDADDEIDNNAFSAFVKLNTLYPSIRCLVGQSKWIHNGMDITHRMKSFTPYVSNTPYFDNWRNRYRSGIRNVLIHKSLIDEYGGFDERMSFFEDWEFTLRLLKCGKVAVTSSLIGIYNQDEYGLSVASHPVETEMAYYTPELIKKTSFWYKCLLFSNIEQTKLFWASDAKIISFYEGLQKKSFSWIFIFMHGIRQRLLNHNII